MNPKKIGETTIDGEKIEIFESRFVDSGGLAFMTFTAFGEPYAKLGVHLDAADMTQGSAKIAKDEFFVRACKYDTKFLAEMLKTGLFEDTGRRVLYGRDVPGQVWRRKL